MTFELLPGVGYEATAVQSLRSTALSARWKERSVPTSTSSPANSLTKSKGDMRQSIAAAAIIRSDRNGQVLWLARWSRSWQRFHLVGGHKNDEESFRECLVREIGEELRLAEGADYEMAAKPMAHLEFTAWSEGAKEETAYTSELFEVDLRGPARVKLDAEPAVRWLSEAEIRAGCCSDGKPISQTMQLILTKINWGRPV